MAIIAAWCWYEAHWQHWDRLGRRGEVGRCPSGRDRRQPGKGSKIKGQIQSIFKTTTLVCEGFGINRVLHPMYSHILPPSSWVDSLFWLGCRRDLEQTDLYTHPSEAASEKLLKTFNRYSIPSVRVWWARTSSLLTLVKEEEGQRRGGSSSHTNLVHDESTPFFIDFCWFSHWRTELQRKKEGKRPRLLVTILKCFWWRILLHGVIFFTEVY